MASNLAQSLTPDNILQLLASLTLTDFGERFKDLAFVQVGERPTENELDQAANVFLNAMK